MTTPREAAIKAIEQQSGATEITDEARCYVQYGEIALVPKHAICDMPAESHKVEQGYYDGHIGGYGGTVDAR